MADNQQAPQNLSFMVDEVDELYEKCIVRQSIIHIALVVRDYDEAIVFYTNTLNFELLEDTFQPEQGKRWVVISHPGSIGVTLLLARASESDRLVELVIRLEAESSCS